MFKENILKEKTIIVTGGGTGLGKSMATKFSELGANIVITSRKSEVIEKTASEITSNYGIHISQVNNWKKQALESIPDAFSGKRKKHDADQQELIDELYKQIGQLKVENDFLKKNY